jgi:hypothetical protein
MQHLDEGTIHAWLDGALPANESAGVERHVAQCKECASLVAEARGMIAGASRIVSALDIVPGGVIPKSSRANASSGSLWRALRFTPSRAALAATLVLAVSTVLTLRHDTADKLVPPTVAIAPAPLTSATPAATPAPANEERSTRPEAKPAPSVVKADQAASVQRQVADTRTLMRDSAPLPRSEKQTVAERKSANTAVAQSIVATAPPAAPPVAAGASPARAAAMDSVRVLTKVSVDSSQSQQRRRDSTSVAPVAAAAERRFRSAEGARETSDMLARLAGNAFTGCYQLTDTSAKDKSFPTRFSLDLVRADPGSNVVRVVTAEGIVDTVITRASWQPVAPNMVDVRVPSGDRTLRLMIRTSAGSTNGSATITGDGAARSAGVTRIDCRR